ncbi:uncharacterized protein PODANS_2_5910 [Podospora anserina S mat+]|uniref:Podospora anserina S mat+ genomic DNA chromosome 2, supercontig 2 n=1 Tax=Podospora anserina (strain S / ATCC MYA-4624 / DSM 980 / FGSC 10383) TaxID=515849 RepID=B2B5V7_PODAN|nr:uncharacterized protein PODANS_2_5910 [Podospora anserina S mat+]CAP73182.1 unnamed protein product [Podospora anserina S mat+]CDP25585.1 Putative protein of unknown function [Podospora anserina S mat+]
MGDRNIETLLKTGSWTIPSRSRSPHPYVYHETLEAHVSNESSDRRPYEDDQPSRSHNYSSSRDYSDRPTREYSDRPAKPYHDEPPKTYNDGPTRSYNDIPARYRETPSYYSDVRPQSNISVPKSKRAPRPLVEEEHESLAKESAESLAGVVSDEEPPYRGEVDQQPLLLPVHEHNPERRFVIIPGAGEDGSATEDEHYETNTCRKYVIVPPNEEGKDKKESKDDKGDRKPAETAKRQELPRRKSHQDLPRLDTHLDERDQDPTARVRRSNSRHDREKPVIDQDSWDRPSARDERSARPGPPRDDELLTPAVKYSNSTRRDREYRAYDTGKNPASARSPSTRGDRVDPRTTSDNRGPSTRLDPGYPPSAGGHKRASSTVSGPPRDDRTRDRPRSMVYPIGNFEGFDDGGADDIMSFMAPGINFDPSRKKPETSPQRGPQSSQHRNHRAGEGMPIPQAYVARHGRSNTRERNDYSSDDSHRGRRQPRGERPYPTHPSMEPEYPPEMVSPEQARVPKPRTGSPLPFPTDDSPDPSPQHATFPRHTRGRSDYRSNSPSPPRRRGTGHGRDASMSTSSQPGSMAGSLGRTNGLDSRRPQAKNPAIGILRQESSLDPKSPVMYWQKGRFDPLDETSSPAAQVISVRRYLEDASKGLLPQLPTCHFQNPTSPYKASEAGQWMTLQRAENFIICPDCYKDVFANSTYQHLFLPAPPPQQPVSCDFGSQFWYRIAFILSLKHNHTDLRLLQAASLVAARHQPCAGGVRATRIWYGILSPNSRHPRPIPGFEVCSSCAKTCEALLPNLAGVFVPLDNNEPMKGTCEMHYSPDRKRFMDLWDHLEGVSDQAVKMMMAPDLVLLADKVRDTVHYEECKRNTPLRNKKWFMMERLPEMTVCGECFWEVVVPLLEQGRQDGGDVKGEIPRNFYKHMQRVEGLASCQLYSERMRNVFRLAAERADWRFLEKEVLERMRAIVEIEKRYKVLMEMKREGADEEMVEGEVQELIRKLKVVE